MKKIIAIASAALMSLSLFACGMTTTKTTRTIEDVPYSTTRVVRRADTRRYKAPRTLTPNTVRTYDRVDAPNLLPYVMSGNGNAYNTTTTRTVRNTATNNMRNNRVYNNTMYDKNMRNSVYNNTMRSGTTSGAYNTTAPYNVNN